MQVISWIKNKYLIWFAFGKEISRARHQWNDSSRDKPTDNQVAEEEILGDFVPRPDSWVAVGLKCEGERGEERGWCPYCCRWSERPGVAGSGRSVSSATEPPASTARLTELYRLCSRTHLALFRGSCALVFLSFPWTMCPVRTYLQMKVSLLNFLCVLSQSTIFLFYFILFLRPCLLEPQ